MKLVILAGGKGTRLGCDDLPKPLVPIAGKPVLQWLVELASRSGMHDVVVISQFRAEKIQDFLGDGSRFGVHVTHIVERSPMGTAGAIKLLEGQIDDRFAVIYGDVICDFEIQRLIAFDATEESLATIVVHPNNHPHDSDLLQVDPAGHVTQFFSKPHEPGKIFQNLVNAGAYVLGPEIFRHIPAETPSDFGRDIFPRIVSEGLKVRAYRTFEYLRDMGTSDRLRSVERDLLAGRVSRRNRKHKQRAIFLDRDGVLNEDLDNVRRTADLRLLDGAAAAVRAINDSEYLAVVVTNQPVVAKGFCTEAELFEIHKKLEWELAAGGAYLDALYHCPHHPEAGFAGEVKHLKIDCACRKPKPGMLLQAARDLNLDLENSWIVGDRSADIAAGMAANVKGVLVRTKEPGAPPLDCRPFAIAANVTEAVSIVLAGRP